MEEQVGRLRRRRHSAEFKAEAVAACRQPGASIAAAAMRRSINANMLRRWVLEAERAEGDRRIAPAALTGPSPSPTKESFLAVPMLSQAADEPPIRIEVRRGATTVSVQWPASAMPECALWLRELLR